MIKNADGWVAIYYPQSTNPYIRLGNGNEYKFITKRNICLCYVRPEDVETVLNHKLKKCCGGTRRQFMIATELQVQRWSI